MSKRFIADNYNYEIWDNDALLSFDQTVELLNQLSEENEQLKKDNSTLKQQRDYLFDVIDEVLPHSGSTTVYNRMQDIGDFE